uniref:Uncharacterized protein n=1 Tax=Lygus hesperus TaxID=30085 RepID=A0A146LW93_LYGHE
MGGGVLPEVVFPVEGFGADEADVGFDARVGERVSREVLRPLERLGAGGAAVGPLVRVGGPVALEVLPAGVTRTTDPTDEPSLHLGLFARVHYVVASQVFVPFEGFWARSAGVRPLVRMGELVSVEVLLSFQACSTNATNESSFNFMRGQVGFEQTFVRVSHVTLWTTVQASTVGRIYNPHVTKSPFAFRRCRKLQKLSEARQILGNFGVGCGDSWPRSRQAFVNRIGHCCSVDHQLSISTLLLFYEAMVVVHRGRSPCITGVRRRRRRRLRLYASEIAGAVKHQFCHRRGACEPNGAASGGGEPLELPVEVVTRDAGSELPWVVHLNLTGALSLTVDVNLRFQARRWISISVINNPKHRNVLKNPLSVGKP